MKRKQITITQLSLNKNDRRAIEEFTQRARMEFSDKICALKLFGSKIRKRASVAESDIDILIVVKDNKLPIANRLIDIAFEVNLKYEVYISPRILPEPVFTNALWRSTPFIQHLEKEAVAI